MVSSHLDQLSRRVDLLSQLTDGLEEETELNASVELLSQIMTMEDIHNKYLDEDYNLDEELEELINEIEDVTSLSDTISTKSSNGYSDVKETLEYMREALK